VGRRPSPAKLRDRFILSILKNIIKWRILNDTTALQQQYNHLATCTLLEGAAGRASEAWPARKIPRRA
jgi:hypothetical protein